jgi:hypothetical protein
MKLGNREKLLLDLYHPDCPSGQAPTLARTAAAHARKRRRQKKVGAAIACALLLTISATVHIYQPSAPQQIASARTAPAYEIISDAELLSLVEDRPLLVVLNENGSSQIASFAH